MLINAYNGFGAGNQAVTDPYFANVVTLLHFDGNLTDVKGRTWTDSGDIAANGVAKFGTYSLNSDGVNGYLSATDSDDFTFGADDFTVEMWIRPHAVGQSNGSVVVYGSPNANSNPCSVGIYIPSGTYEYRYNIGNTSGGFHFSGQLIGSGAVNTWAHLAISRNGTTIRSFMDGVGGYSYTIGTAEITNPTGFVLGGGNFPNCYFNGEIDEVRITKGVGRYTADFSPPIAAFPDQ